jgi:hypothetical protein
LSLLLFVIVMEALDKMISVVVSRGLLSSFFVGTWNVGGIDISHLLFANDTLIFCWNSKFAHVQLSHSGEVLMALRL